MVKSGGDVADVLDATEKQKPKEETEPKNKVEVFFYESISKDLFVVLAGDVPIIIEPLPVSDIKGNKKLSLWQAYWNLRHSESPYGIGIYEAIRYDQAMLDRIRNMTVDQLTLSIYKMFFYQGTQSLTETGDIKITPGVGKQVLNPKDLTWLDIPGPGKDAYAGIELMRRDIDESSGIGDPLLGQVTGKTAFEIAQAKESALKRMKNPLDNILDALNTEGYITLALIQMVYSIPETYEIADPLMIEEYLNDIKGDSSLFERNPKMDEQGNPVMNEQGQMEDVFTAKVYPEFPLNLEKDENENLIETRDTQFFRIKPNGLNWEGVINIKSQSILSPSKQVDKALELEMFNLLIPLMMNPPELYQKIAKEICKLYDKDPRDILPDQWMQPPAPPNLFMPAGQLLQQQMGMGQQEQAPGLQQGPGQAQKMVPQTQVPAQQSQGIVGKLMSRIGGR
jgi:hypothetical protein